MCGIMAVHVYVRCPVGPRLFVSAALGRTNLYNLHSWDYKICSDRTHNLTVRHSLKYTFLFKNKSMENVAQS